MEDKRPIVYVARAIRCHDRHYNNVPLAYFVSKARLQSEKTSYTKKGEKIKSYEFELYPYELDLSQIKTLADDDVFTDVGYFVQSNFIANDYKTCCEHVANLNKTLLEIRLKDYNYTVKKYIPIVKQLESVYITEEEMLGIEEEKGQE